MIPPSFIQDLLNRVDIVDVVGRYVQLKKSGANFMGLCPFHNEKSASFTVSPTKQFYHCFGCGAHGTVISFLINYSGLNFVEAVKDLAQNIGMTVPEHDDKISPAQRAALQAQSLALSDAMNIADKFYRQNLRSEPQAISYLQGRGLTGDIAAKFGLGYATSNRNGLRHIFPDYEATALVEAGLVIDRTNAEGMHQRYDRFRDRIMFPIRNIKGQVIGFGGRVLGSGEPKYLNSPETTLFQKGNELYGLFEARQAIHDAGYILVTEGYMDVVALAQLGFPQTVATLGTACTATQVRKLLRQTDRVIFSFDGDDAGQRAAQRALEACLPHAIDNKIIRFLFLPKEHDPDSYIREYGFQGFEKQIHDAMPLSQFLLNIVTSQNDLNTHEGRARAQFEAKPFIQALPPASLRLQIIRELAKLTQSTTTEIESLFELNWPTTRARHAPPRSNRPAPVGLERQIIRLVVAHPTLISELDASALSAIAHLAPDRAAILTELITASQTMGAQANFAALAEYLREAGTEFETLIAEIAAESTSEIEPRRLELRGAIRQTKIKILKSELEQVMAATNLDLDEKRRRYDELMSKQEILRHQAEIEAEASNS